MIVAFFSGCAGLKEGTLRITFADSGSQWGRTLGVGPPSKTNIQPVKNESENAHFGNEENLEHFFPKVKRIEVRGYENAQTPAKISFNMARYGPGFDATTGIPTGPPTPGQMGLGRTVVSLGVLAGLLVVAGVVSFFFLGDKRVGVGLFLAAFVCLAMSVAVVKMEAIPTWLWVVGFTVTAALAAWSYGMKTGWKIHQLEGD